MQKASQTLGIVNFKAVNFGAHAITPLRIPHILQNDLGSWARDMLVIEARSQGERASQDRKLVNLSVLLLPRE